MLMVSLCVIVYLISMPSRSTELNGNSTPTTSKRSPSSLAFWQESEADEFKPAIAWLMSYPNSGTSYTMTCVESTTNRSTASNYGDEVTAKDDFSLPIYPGHPEGPYWKGLYGKIGQIRPLPKGYVLVKTHCGSRCVRCPPEQYVETYQSYLDACRNSTARLAPERKRVSFLYDENRVKKAIHLIRNPFHNFVARFHLDWKHFKEKGDDAWIKEHPSDPVGFQKWCMDLDNQFEKEEYETFEYYMVKQLRLSICHGEVFKYIQWHNLAFQVTRKLGLNPMVIHYEDYYEDKFNNTLDDMLDYLELDGILPPKKQFHAKDGAYARYYTFLDKRRIKLLVEKIASADTWDAIKHYFDKNASIHDTDLSASHDVGKPPIGDK